jgi:hypothetical protein
MVLPSSFGVLLIPPPLRYLLRYLPAFILPTHALQIYNIYIMESLSPAFGAIQNAHKLERVWLIPISCVPGTGYAQKLAHLI